MLAWIHLRYWQWEFKVMYFLNSVLASSLEKRHIRSELNPVSTPVCTVTELL